MLHPTPRCVWLFALGLPLALLPSLFGEALWLAWAIHIALVTLLGAIDAALCATRKQVEPQVAAPLVLALGESGEIRLAFGIAARTLTLEWYLEFDERFRSVAANTHPLRRGIESEATMRIVPERRGRASLRALWLRWQAPMGLLRRTQRIVLDRTIDITPDVRGAHQKALRFLAEEQRTTQGRMSTYRGEGSEFESLREYVAGMDHRRINWKASARHRAPLATQFRAERDHQMLLAVDTGHLMNEPLAGRTKLDHFIQAALTLSWVSLRTGDRAGLAAFDEELRSFVAPARGSTVQRRIEAAAAAMESRAVETNYTRGVLEIAQRLRRRSLIVCFTEFVDSVSAELMVQNLGQLARQHFVLFVALQDPAQQAFASSEPEDLRSLCAASVMGAFLEERRAVIERLRHLGVHVLVTTPEELSTRLMQRYLEIHARELVA